eukprot:TRINITY_DN1244_c0_g1_i20.p3 TRINITY_DN1244_c0_g1~~TRINITY_DN1244_c0_g1_i20.p3  ORF type:complete len:125 (+),score=1.61 TRINITY_DN1244_c0_g1_i20:162-536(+)
MNGKGICLAVTFSLGTYYYANGDKYEGEFKDGKRNGGGICLVVTFLLGTLYYAKGGKYEGEWKDDNMNRGGICLVVTLCQEYIIMLMARNMMENGKTAKRMEKVFVWSQLYTRNTLFCWWQKKW